MMDVTSPHLLSPIGPNGRKIDSPEAAWSAAKEFESMFVSDFLQHIFAGTDATTGLFGGGQGESYFRSLWTKNLAESCKSIDFGVAAGVYRVLLKEQEGGGHV